MIDFRRKPEPKTEPVEMIGFDETANIYEKAKQASEILQSPAFQQAMRDLGDGLTKQWRQTSSDQVELRERIAAEVRSLDAIRVRLQGWIDAVKLEDDKIARIERRRA